MTHFPPFRHAIARLAGTIGVAAVVATPIAQAQTVFADTVEMPAGYVPDSILMPPSPLTTQVLFIGGTDIVQAPGAYGNDPGPALAKEWHDFIGFTPDGASGDLGWVSVNHEMIYRDDRLGDGGGMTVFKVRRAADGSLAIVDQTLADGREGKFFGVDFANTVGETGMNCGGISSMVDGRIWTAEEWFRTSNRSINFGNTGGSSFPLEVGSDANQGVRDTSDFTIDAPEFPDFHGMTLKKYENFNWMVEIDPRQAKAIRKQYNWGRQPFEGGAVEPSNQVVYLGPDDTPGFFGMFVAETPGDFTKGTLFAYKHDKPGYKWVPIWGTDDLLDHTNAAARKGATMYNRIEWVAIDPLDNNAVYFTETGRDFPGRAFGEGIAAGAVHDPYHVARAQALGIPSPTDRAYPDFYGRIWRYDAVRDTLEVYLEGGPALDASPSEANYPAVHLSNPDGLNVMKIDGRSFLVINEDLNGRSYGRVPDGVSNSTCEVFILDLSIDNPTLDDLIRITAVPRGSEVTGACPTPDGKSLLLNVQHPNASNPFPYNHSLTFAIHGFDQVRIPRKDETQAPTAPAEARRTFDTDEAATAFRLAPNPTTRMVSFGRVEDVAVYSAATGQRVLVRQQVDRLDVSDLTPGAYLVQNSAGEVVRLIVQ